MVLTAYFVLSPVIGLFCHRRLADISAKFDVSVETSGPQDFAVRYRAIRQRRCQRPLHPAPTSVTIAKRPSVGRDGIKISLFLPRRQIKFGNSEINLEH
jgi:hypothetical protein